LATVIVGGRDSAVRVGTAVASAPTPLEDDTRRSKNSTENHDIRPAKLKLEPQYRHPVGAAVAITSAQCRPSLTGIANVFQDAELIIRQWHVQTGVGGSKGGPDTSTGNGQGVSFTEGFFCQAPKKYPKPSFPPLLLSRAVALRQGANFLSASAMVEVWLSRQFWKGLLEHPYAPLHDGFRLRRPDHKNDSTCRGGILWETRPTQHWRATW